MVSFCGSKRVRIISAIQARKIAHNSAELLPVFLPRNIEMKRENKREKEHK